jgi:hypothetical protein
MERVGFAGVVTRTFVIRLPLLDIRSMAGMPSMPWPALISYFRFRQPWMICMLLPCYARASSVSAVFVSQVLNPVSG